MESMRIMVTGAGSQLAQSIQASPELGGHDLILLDHSQLDITSAEDWRKALDEVKPQVVINTAAFTNVEGAEDQAEEARRVNAKAPGIGAALSAEVGAHFLHISTDYVFDGMKRAAYIETDLPSPLNVYGSTKLQGEQEVMRLNPDAWVIRVSWLYSPFGRNFMKTMLKLFASQETVRVVNDQVASPTCALSFADHLLRFVSALPPGGLYHYSENGEASWFDLAKAIHEISGASCQLEPVSSDAFPTKAERPSYSKLSNKKISSIFTAPLPHWRETLERCLQYE